MISYFLLLCICFQPQVEQLPHKYEAEDGAFSLRFPSKPEEQEVETGTIAGKSELIGYRDPGKLGLFMIVYDFPEGHVKQRGIEEFFEDMLKGTGEEAGPKPKSVETMKINGFPARSYTFEMPDGMEMLSRTVVVNDRVYAINVLRQNDGSQTTITKEFLTSFQVNSLPYLTNHVDFTCRFPARPELDYFESDAEGADDETRHFIFDEKTSCFLALSYYDFPKGYVKKQGRESILTAARKRLYESPKISLQKYRSFMDRKHECLEVQAGSEDEEIKVIARYYLVDDRMYRLFVHQQSVGKGDKITKDFFDSFRIVEKDPLPVKLTPEDELFTARFPSSPKQETAADQLSEEIALPKVSWIVESANGQFLIQKTEFPEGFLAKSADDIISLYKNQLVDACKGQIIKSENIKNEIFEGNNSVIESDNSRIFARYFSAKNHIYRILVSTDRSGDNDELATAFLDSFKLKNPLPHVHKNEKANFSVNFPSKPKAKTVTTNDVEVDFLQCFSDGILFQVTCNKIPEEANKLDRNDLRKVARDENAKQLDGRILSYELVDEEGKFGQRYVIRNDEFEINTQSYVIDEIEISLVTIREIGKEADWRESLFFNSLAFGSE